MMGQNNAVTKVAIIPVSRLRILLKLLRKSLIPILIAFTVTLARFLIIHHYVDWRFLWGGDQVPILNMDQFLKSVFTLQQPWRDVGVLFIPQLTLTILSYVFTKLVAVILSVNPLATNMPGWISESVLFLIGVAILWYVATSIDPLNNIHKVAIFAILITLFAFNPWSTIDTFKSYLGMTSIATALNYILIAFYLRLWKIMFRKQNVEVEKIELLFVVAATLALCTISPSGSIRVFAFSVVIWMIFAGLLMLAHHRGAALNARKTMFLSLIVPATSAIVVLLYLTAGYFEALKGRVVSIWGSTTPPVNVLYPSYATLSNSFIGMNSWVAHSGYMPYHEIYERGYVAASMFLWPLLTFSSLLVITITKDKRLSIASRYQIIFLTILGLVAITWGTALNPPLSIPKKLLVLKIPLIVKVMPWDASTSFLIPTYLILSSYVLGYIMSSIFPSSERLGLRISLKNGIGLLLRSLIPILILASLLYSALPIFTGEVFEQYYNKNVRGFNIPNDYVILSKLSTKFYEHILLLPATHTYTSTSWGWQGSVAWYHRLNEALLTYSLVPYSEYTEWSKVYYNLAIPCLHAVGGFPLTQYVDLNHVNAWNGKILSTSMLSNGTLSIQAVIFNGNHTDIILPFNRPTDISRYKLLEIVLSVKSNVTNVTLSPWLFIYSGNYGGAHILEPIQLPSGKVSKAYAVGVPDKPWPLSMYYPNNTTGLVLRLKVSSYNANTSAISIAANLTVIVSNEYTFCNQYLDLLRIFNIRYIVVDRSLADYNTFYKIVEDALRKEFRLIYNGTTLSIYEISCSTALLHIIVEPNQTNISILRLTPSSIVAYLEIPNNSSEVIVVTPVLFSDSLPNPFTVSAYAGKEKLEVDPIDYNGLYGYRIRLVSNAANKQITIYMGYSMKFLVLYLTFLTLSIAPLAMFVAVAILYLKSLLNNTSEERFLWADRNL